MKKLKILLADDHEMLREGIHAYLKDQEDLQVIGEAANGQEVLKRLSKPPRPEMVIMDINMPKLDGIDATVAIKKRYPNTKVLILSMHNRAEFIKKLIEAGADGYILKNSGRRELLKAVRQIAEGERYFSEEIVRTGFNEAYFGNVTNQAELTKREKQVVKLIANGLSSDDIARELNITRNTVDSHRKKIIIKINARNTADITRYALKTGIVKGFDIK